MRISDWSSGRVLFRSVRTRMVRVLLLEAVDGGQRLLGLAVFPVDISLIDERLLGISAKRVARFNGLEASACVVPVSGTDFGDRKSVVSGTSVSVRVDLGGRRIINKKNNI